MFFAKTFIDAMLIARKTLRSNHFQGQDPPNQSCTTSISNQGKGCCFPRRHGTGNLFFPEKFHRPSSASRLPAWSYTVLSPFSSTILGCWLLLPALTLESETLFVIISFGLPRTNKAVKRQDDVDDVMVVKERASLEWLRERADW